MLMQDFPEILQRFTATGAARNFVLPFPGLGAGCPEHPLTGGLDQAVAFRDSYERIRWHETRFRVLPAEKTFPTSDSSSAKSLAREKSRHASPVKCSNLAVVLGHDSNPGNVICR